MMPPTSIDGTDITGATIDGTDVQEITVDGQTVFSAQTLPVAYSNLVGWYPFDSATYGGANADDVTAIIGGSGDDTAYDGTLSGATYQSSGGVTDINAGANSGAFDFDGSNDFIQTSKVPLSSHTKMAWFNADSLNGLVFGAKDSPDSEYTFINIEGGDLEYIFDDGVVSFDRIITETISASQWIHAAITYDSTTSSSNCEMFIDGVSVGTASKSSGITFDNNQNIGENVNNDDRNFNGNIDDCRIYNRVLTAIEISDIYNRTEP